MSTHFPRFRLFLRFFASFCIGSSSIRVKRYRYLYWYRFQEVLYDTISFIKGTLNDINHCEVIIFGGLSRILNISIHMKIYKGNNAIKNRYQYRYNNVLFHW